MYLTLFPDFFSTDGDTAVEEAQRIQQALREVDLSLIYNQVEHRKVLKRLSKEGVRTAWELLQVPREEIAAWQGVGPVFLMMLDEMREEVKHSPNELLARWHREHASLILPENEREQEEGEDDELHALLLVEQAFVELLQLLAHRWGHEGEALRRFFLEGIPLDSLLRTYGFPSRRSFSRLLRRRFLRPLWQGQSLCGLSLSAASLEELERLRCRLLFAPLSVLNGLRHMAPQRFLLLLGFVVLQRSSAEQHWVGDFMVREGEITLSRHLLQRSMAKLQQQVTALPLTQLQHLFSKPRQIALLPSLLQHHPWIELNEEKVQLSTLYLTEETIRLQRLLHEQPEITSPDSLLAAYAYCYLEHPSEQGLLRCWQAMDAQG